MASAPVGPHRVRRPFDADGVRMIPGEIVDVTGFRNGFQLIERGFLVALPIEEKILIENEKPAQKKAAAKKPAAKKAATKKSAD